MSTRKTKRPKPKSIEAQRARRLAQRAALHDAICAVGEFMASNGIGSESNDWHTALDAARTNLPVDDSRPLALALAAAAYVVDLNGQRATETGVKVHTLAAGVVGNPVPLWVFHLYQDVPNWVMRFGSHEMNVQSEACKSVAEHPEWAVARAAASLHLVASRAVSQALSECVARPIVEDDTTAQDLLVGAVSRFAEALARDDTTAQDLLVGAVSRFAEALARDLGVPWKAGEGDKQPTTLDDAVAMYGETVRAARDTGMFPWDEVLAKHLEAIGENGRDAAETVRRKGRETMASVLEGAAQVGQHAGPGAMLRRWNDPSYGPLGVRWLNMAAKALWHDKVKPELDRAHAPRVAAVAPRVVVEAGIRAMGAERLIMSSTLPQTLVGQRGDGPEYPISLALVTSGAVQAVLGDITNGSDDHLWLVFDWVVRAVHQQEQGGVPSPHIITVRGGKDGLRQAVGVASKGQADSVFNALHTLHLLSVVGASKGEPRLLSYSIEQPRGRPARGRPEKLIVIDVGWAMMPHGAAKLGLADRWKVAILPPAYRPEVGRRTTGSRQANAYQSLSLIALEHRREIAREGAFRLTADEWNHHADAAGLYRRSHASLGRDVFDAYLAPPPAQLALGCRPRTGPILVPVEKGSDWYRFGPDFQPEWEHYRQAGDFSEGQAARGEANTAKVVAAAAKARKAKAAKRKREG